MNYQKINAEAIDTWCLDGWVWGQPISHELYQNAQKGEWDVLLTPTKAVPHEWFGSLCGKKVLGLASGGGQQILFLLPSEQIVPYWIILPNNVQVSS